MIEPNVTRTRATATAIGCACALLFTNLDARAEETTAATPPESLPVVAPLESPPAAAPPASAPAAAPPAAPTAAAPAESAPAAPARVKAPSALYLTYGGGAIADQARGAFTGSLVMTRPLWRGLSLEIGGAIGWSPSGPAREDLAWGRLSLGARLEPVRARLRPFVAVRAMHIHMATLATWRMHPVDSAAGSSEHGLGHRSGLALAGGGSWEVPGTKERLRLVLALEGAWIAIGHGPRFMLDAQMGAGVTF
jgi:hypothetical protein